MHAGTSQQQQQQQPTSADYKSGNSCWDESFREFYNFFVVLFQKMTCGSTKRSTLQQLRLPKRNQSRTKTALHTKPIVSRRGHVLVRLQWDLNSAVVTFFVLQSAPESTRTCPTFDSTCDWFTIPKLWFVQFARNTSTLISTWNVTTRRFTR